MIKVVLIGGGNVAQHLVKVFYETKSVSLIQVYNRSRQSIEHLKKYTSITGDLSKIEHADIYIISVSDNAIEFISSKLPVKNALVVHTSGSTAIKVLKNHKRHGVFYPLQTFSKNREVDFKTVPICLEATNLRDFDLLKQLAGEISDTFYQIDSEQRKKLHTAAVFVNNFVNHLYYIGSDICERYQVDMNILRPLIKETAEKALDMAPFDAQTGPARRGDKSTLKKHLKNLPPNQQEIYKLLSHSIAKTYGKKL